MIVIGWGIEARVSNPASWRKHVVGKHPGDLSRGRAFLWTAPSQRVYCFITYLYYH